MCVGLNVEWFVASCVASLRADRRGFCVRQAAATVERQRKRQKLLDEGKVTLEELEALERAEAAERVGAISLLGWLAWSFVAR